jgi:regulator of RNase E activity RraA
MVRPDGLVLADDNGVLFTEAATPARLAASEHYAHDSKCEPQSLLNANDPIIRPCAGVARSA